MLLVKYATNNSKGSIRRRLTRSCFSLFPIYYYGKKAVGFPTACKEIFPRTMFYPPR
jgi:hypothetical protein